MNKTLHELIEDDKGYDLGEIAPNILFLFMLIFLGGTFFRTFKSYIPLPYTVVLFLYGLLVGALTRVFSPGVNAALGAMPPELIFYIFLPVLIFEGSYAINIYALKRVLPQVVILATVGVILNTIFLCFPIKWSFTQWNLYESLLLGSLLSATDPVAVVALLKGLGVDKHLTALVDAESVMNDGTAMIAFTLLLPAAKAGRISTSLGMILLESLRLTLFPLVIGPAFGFLQSFWLRHTSDEMVKVCITVSVTYVSYYVAAYIVGTSGVLTLFFQGMFLSYFCPSVFPGQEGNLISSTWEFLVHLLNTTLFSLVGIIVIADVVPTLSPVDVIVTAAIYISTLICRWLMLEVLLPVLNGFTYQIDQNGVFVLVHSGLRGGVAVTLALAVVQEGLEHGVTMLKVTCGVVLLTLLVNATTAEAVVTLCGHRSKSRYRLQRMRYAMEYLRETSKRSLERLKRDTKYRNTNWASLEKYTTENIRNPFENMKDIYADEDVCLNRLLMSAFKASLWRQRNEQIISETVVVTLGHRIADAIESGRLLEIQALNLQKKSKRSTLSPSPPPQAPIDSRDMLERCADTDGAAAGVTKGLTGEFVENSGGAATSELPPCTEAVVIDDDSEVQAIMRNLLPSWVQISERFLLGHGFFVSAHRRVQQNAFMCLLAFIRCLTDVEKIKFQYVRTNEQAARVERWITKQSRQASALVRFFYANFPDATTSVATCRAVLRVANDLQDAISNLYNDHGFCVRLKNLLQSMVHDLRENSPMQWGNLPAQDQDLVVRALSASTLGRGGLSKAEIQAISAMGLLRTHQENEIVQLGDNYFLVIVFGSLQPLHSSWTTLGDNSANEGFGSIIGLQGIVLPAVLLRERRRHWKVVSPECRTLSISFNTINPFLMVRSFAAVQALWRSVAVKVIYPFIENIVTLPLKVDEEDKKDHLTRLIMDGRPFLGPSASNDMNWKRQFHLCFYLRGCDRAGLFNGPTPPCYISAFFANQLQWDDPQVVLYAVPVNINDNGYVPWRMAPSTAAECASRSYRQPQTEEMIALDQPNDSETRAYSEDIDLIPNSKTETFASNREDQVSLELPNDVDGSNNPSSRLSHSTSNQIPLHSRTARHSTLAVATDIFNSILQGKIPDFYEDVSSDEGRADDNEYNVDMDVSCNISSPMVSFRFHAEHSDGGYGAECLSQDTSRRKESCSEISLESSPPRLNPLRLNTCTQHSSFASFSPSDSQSASILQRLCDFVTHIPFINQLFIRYASILEMLCVATVRYIQSPNNTLNIRHAKRTCEISLDFLLCFCNELALLKKTFITVANKFTIEELKDSHTATLGKVCTKCLTDTKSFSQEIDERDADFTSKVCAWNRLASFNGRFRLKVVVMEMNAYANWRFPHIVHTARALSLLAPMVKEIGTVEDLRKDFI